MIFSCRPGGIPFASSLYENGRKSGYQYSKIEVRIGKDKQTYTACQFQTKDLPLFPWLETAIFQQFSQTMFPVRFLTRGWFWFCMQIK
jgi:hypothetical protein